MGNCQAAEAATVVIQHPGNKVERIYWSVSAHEVMNSNPGHYVALVVTSPATPRTENGTPVRQLKLLRPDDTLVMGHVYRLISFEDVLKEFAAKKCVKLGKLLKESGGLSPEPKQSLAATDHGAVLKLKPKLSNGNSAKVEHQDDRKGGSSSGGSSGGGGGGGGGGSGSGSRGVGAGRHHHGGGQWKPALQSIAEIGT